MVERISALATCPMLIVRFCVAGAACGALAGCAILFGPHEKQAEALLLPTLGNQVAGHISFVERSDGIEVSYNITGLPPNTDHGFHVHERGDCSAPDASSALGAFSIDESRHGRPGRTPHQVGELSNIHADADGVAIGLMVSPDITLDGVRSVVGRAIIVDRDADDYFTQPDGNSGPALACGVIRR